MEDSAEMAMDDGATSPSSPPTARKEGVDYSGTNNQEQGVDEADFVKTNGNHIFFVDNGVCTLWMCPNLVKSSTHQPPKQGRPVA